MRLLLRALPIFLLVGICTASLAQSNNPSGSSNVHIEYAPGYEPNNGNTNGNNSTGLTSGSAQSQTGTSGSISEPLSQQQIDNINQTITMLQNQLQQINDPNDPRAIKLQKTIEMMQDIVNNQ